MFIRLLSILALCLPVAAATSPRVILNASASGPSRYIVALDDDVDVSAAADALTRRTHRDLRAVHGFIAEMSRSEASAASELIAAASLNKVQNAGTSSPNRLLFTTDLQAPTPPRRRAVKSP